MQTTARNVCLLLLIVFAHAEVATAQQRIWTDHSGEHKIRAKWISTEGDEVLLRRPGGVELRVKLNRLSQPDRDLARRLQKQQRPKAKADAGRDDQAMQKKDSENANASGVNANGANGDAQQSGVRRGESDVEIVRASAMAFFEGLRDPDRAAARKTLTSAARQINDDTESPLFKLPSPDPGRRAILTGRVAMSGETAEVPVNVLASGQRHSTRLHLRREDDQWQVFAISATYPEGEKSVDFEAEPNTAGRGSPIESLVGSPMPLVGYTLAGPPLDMSRYAGKVVLVDFWATWCGPCRQEIPNILDNWNQYHDKGFEVVAISLDRDLPALREYVVENRLPWTVVADKDPRSPRAMAAQYGVRSIPTAVLIGADGKVISVNARGPRLGKELARQLGDG